MKSLTQILVLALSSSALLFAGEPIFEDPFTADLKVPERRAVRGDWRIEKGVASVTQDDELYRKYKDHGPIIFYDFPTTNANFSFSVKPTGCKTVVFTLNKEEGHVFRFVTSQAGTNFRAFPPEGDKKSIPTGREKDWVLPEDEWTNIKVSVTGSSAKITFGDREPIEFEHSSYDRSKTNFSIGFSFGSLAIREVRVTTD